MTIADYTCGTTSRCLRRTKRTRSRHNVTDVQLGSIVYDVMLLQAGAAAADALARTIVCMAAHTRQERINAGGSLRNRLLRS